MRTLNFPTFRGAAIATLAVLALAAGAQFAFATNRSTCPSVTWTTGLLRTGASDRAEVFAHGGAAHRRRLGTHRSVRWRLHAARHRLRLFRRSRRDDRGRLGPRVQGVRLGRTRQAPRTSSSTRTGARSPAATADRCSRRFCRPARPSAVGALAGLGRDTPIGRFRLLYNAVPIDWAAHEVGTRCTWPGTPRQGRSISVSTSTRERLISATPTSPGRAGWPRAGPSTPGGSPRSTAARRQCKPSTGRRSG